MVNESSFSTWLLKNLHPDFKFIYVYRTGQNWVKGRLGTLPCWKAFLSRQVMVCKSLCHPQVSQSLGTWVCCRWSLACSHPRHRLLQLCTSNNKWIHLSPRLAWLLLQPEPAIRSQPTRKSESAQSLQNSHSPVPRKWARQLNRLLHFSPAVITKVGLSQQHTQPGKKQNFYVVLK